VGCQAGTCTSVCMPTRFVKQVRYDHFCMYLEGIARKAMGNEESQAPLAMNAHGAVGQVIVRAQAQPTHAHLSREAAGRRW
jgi:hypothetical protein